jgi:integrase/recombinase XerD
MTTEIIRVVPVPMAGELLRVTNALVANVAPGSRRVYEIDARCFADWLADRGLSVEGVGFEDVSDYRAWLESQFAKATAARKLVVARRLLDVAVILHLRGDNPAKQVKGFKQAGANETPHRALTRKEAKELLAVIDQASDKGKRDFALITLLLRTGIRRAEAAGLLLSDLGQEQGHHIATIRHGKGDKRRIIKVPVDVLRAISNYLDATGRKQAGPDKPLFVTFHNDKPTGRPVTGLDIERIVEGYAAAAGLDGLTPHGLRASFVTLTLEGGAKLQQVQYAAGHADPRTTERYQKRKLNLDDNAVDYLKL